MIVKLLRVYGECLASAGDEGRSYCDKPRERKQAVIRGCPNGETQAMNAAYPLLNLGKENPRREVKHLSTCRKRINRDSPIVGAKREQPNPAMSSPVRCRCGVVGLVGRLYGPSASHKQDLSRTSGKPAER